MPGFVKTKNDEKKWDKAKEASGKETDKGSKGYWKLANFVFHKMKKSQGLEKAEEFMNSLFKSGETGHEKGIHRSPAMHTPGKDMGVERFVDTTYGHPGIPTKHDPKQGMGESQARHDKEGHKKVLDEMKAQSKPNLPKSEGSINKYEEFINSLGKAETGHEKGINTSTDPKQRSRVMMGTSKAGSTLPSKSHLDVAEAKGAHKEVLKEMKAQPKPNLPKSEEMQKTMQTPTSVPNPMKAGEQSTIAKTPKIPGMLKSEDIKHPSTRKLNDFMAKCRR
jgi:hypothetical protein